MPDKKQQKMLAREERRQSRQKATLTAQQKLNDSSDVDSDLSANSSPATKFLMKRLKHRSDNFLGSILFKRGIDQFSSSPLSDKSDRFSYSSPSNLSDHRSEEAKSNASENDSSILSEQTENEITPADFDYGQPSNSSEHFSYNDEEMSYSRATTVAHDKRTQSNTVELIRTPSDKVVPKFGKASKLSNLGEKLHRWHLEKTLDMRLWKLKMKDASIVLALNRCLELRSASHFLLSGRRINFWLIGCSLYALYWTVFIKPAVFSGLFFAWFYDPFIGYRKTGNEYEERIQIVHDTSVAVLCPIIYFILAAKLFFDIRFPPVIYWALNKTIREDCRMLYNKLFHSNRVNVVSGVTVLRPR
ncbi:hypothetical protein niasHT_039206 [Heterodera trifolii]|uniref:Uncharacterized protein n=1 Tax=Heterodera trifolii TaxID=157864 RepID=A0ABD2IGL9_9BILA